MAETYPLGFFSVNRDHTACESTGCRETHNTQQRAFIQLAADQKARCKAEEEHDCGADQCVEKSFLFLPTSYGKAERSRADEADRRACVAKRCQGQSTC